MLFISPTLITEAPMTIAMLSAIAKEEGWETDSCVNTFKKPLSVEDFVEHAKRFEASIVAISMLTFDVLFVYKIIQALKKNKFKVIVGGPHPTDCPKEVLNAGADCVTIGEGEDHLRDICRNPISMRGIHGRYPPINLSKLPKLDFDVFNHDLFREDDGLIKGFQRIYTSRGCPGYCTFCDWQVFRQNLRTYPVETIISDIKHRKDEYGITSFSVADDCFTLDKERVYEFCKLIRPLNVIWRANSRANMVTPELLLAMRDSGCHSVTFGFESGSKDTLKKIRKGVLLRQNVNAAWMAHDAGLQVYGGIMTGFPWETPDHVEENIQFIRDTWDAVTLFQVSGSLMPFPGTAIYKEYSKQYGFENYWLRPDYQKIGIQIYQNAINPLSVSTFYQRYLFDDTYIQEEKFFKYTLEYKRAVRKMVLEIGKHNLEWMLKDEPRKQNIYMKLASLSMLGYSCFPGLEKLIGGKLFQLNKGHRSAIERLRDKKRGFVRNKDDVECSS